MKKIATIFLSILFVFTISTSSHAVTLDQKQTNDPEYPWTVTFSQPVDRQSVRAELIYIATPSGTGHPVSLSISDDLKKIKVIPKKRYALGTNYRLTISKDVQSANGKLLKEDVVMDFVYEGTDVHDIHAVLNPFTTNVKVQTTKAVATMSVSLNGGTEQEMIKSGETSFSKGLLGVASGDQLLLKAYDNYGNLLEEQESEVTE